jgi:hypothetical protein
MSYPQLFKSWSNSPSTPPKGDYSQIFELRREKFPIFLSSIQKFVKKGSFQGFLILNSTPLPILEEVLRMGKPWS